MRSWCAAVGISVIGLTACAKPQPAPPPPAPNLQPRLDAADALLRVGCFDCLTEALREFDALRAFTTAPPAVVAAATSGALRTAMLLEVRERELGMADDGYLQRARDLTATSDELRTQFAPVFDVVDTIPWRVPKSPLPTVSSVSPMTLAAYRELQAKREQLGEGLKAQAGHDVLSASLWLSFSCANPVGRPETEALLAPLGALRDAPFAAYRAATCPRGGSGFSAVAVDTKAATALLDREPQFLEIEFALGAAAVGAQRLDDAEPHYRRAYEWHPQWPALATSLGNLYMTAEEIQLALGVYEVALTHAPDHGEALIGRVRALSTLGRHDDAFAEIDHIQKGARWFPGEVIYWRAWNELQVGRVEDAWASVSRAESLWAVAQVSKLAGLIAYRRQQLEVARGKFEIGRKQAPDDCEMMFLLGTVHADLRNWAPTAEVFIATGGCVQGAKHGYTQLIAKIQASNAPPERKARQVARAEQKIRDAERMLATSYFNTAAAYFNLSKKAEAREYAEKLTGDPQFAERAREILSRLEK